MGPAPSLPFWIAFDEARNAVETIVDVAHDDPEERPTCIVLVGDSGMGKTSILREVQRRLTADFPEPPDWGDARYQPVLRTVIPQARPRSRSISLCCGSKAGLSPARPTRSRTSGSSICSASRAPGLSRWTMSM
jgi:hypothetical protein